MMGFYALLLFVLALFFLYLRLSLICRRQGEKIKEFERLLSYLEEMRCPICADRAECPAYKTGVAFPCEHYKALDILEGLDYGTKE